MRRGRGGGQVVSVLAFASDDPSSNPANVYSFFCKICVWKEQNKKDAGGGAFKKKAYLEHYQTSLDVIMHRLYKMYLYY